MHVDRAKFFALTSSLAASTVAAASCAEREPVAAVVTPVTIPPQPPASAAPASRAGPGPTDPEPAAVAADSPDDDDEQPYPPWPGTADPPLAKTVNGKSCDVSENLKGRPVPCALKAPPGPTCESFADTRRECAKLARWLTPRAAEKATACLAAKSGKRDICLFNVGVSCAIEAFANACVDTSPKNDAACRKVMTACSAVDRADRHMTFASCKAALSAIVPGRHAKFLHCAEESCDLVPCAYAAQD